MSEGHPMRLDLAQMIAARFMAHISVHVQKMSVAGSVRREVPWTHDVEVVCIPKDEFSMGKAFPEGYYGMTTNGTRLKKFVYGRDGLLPIKLELYITNISDYGRILAIRTGSVDYSRFELAVRWNRISWCGTENGLRKKTECTKKSTWRIKPEYKNCPTLPPVFDTEENFFAFLGIKWIEPKERDWHFKKDKV